MADIAFKIYQKSLQDNGSLIVSGIASTNSKDKEDEAITITPKALKDALPSFYANNAPMKVEHAVFKNNITGEIFTPNQTHFTQDCSWCFPEFADRNVGKVLNMSYSPEEYDIDSPNPLKMEITAVGYVFDPLAIQKILNGDLGSFSLAWQPLAEPWKRENGQELHTAIKINELTFCKVPMNPDAQIESFKVVTDEDLEKQYGLKMGQEVMAYDRVGKLKSVLVNANGELNYELEYSQDYLKSIYVKAISGATPAEGQGLLATKYENLNTRFNQTNLEKKAIENETKEQNKLDQVYTKYHDLVNMSYSELKKWSNNPRSKLASLNRQAINRNLNLLNKKKEDWTDKDIAEANKTIAFISRMSKMPKGANIKQNGKDLGISKRDISLKNWAFNPSKNKASFDPTTEKGQDKDSMVFDEHGFYEILKEAFAKQDKNLTEDDLVNFVYKTIPFTVKFGKEGSKQYTTKIQIGSDKQIKFVQPITEIKKPESK
jgi:hypothetical protein